MEPIKIFLDTNIVIDYFSGRMHDDNALSIMKLGDLPCFELNISFLSAVNTLYLLRKLGSELSPSELAELFNILPQTLGQWKKSQSINMPDFEDALQVACAVDAGCDIFISRDKHFDTAPIKTYTPEEFLSLVIR